MHIRRMVPDDKNAVLEMMRVFYRSPAVLSDGSEEIFRADFEACVQGSPFAEGLIIEEDGRAVGYSMLAKSFSTEFGRPCLWIEDVYILPEFRGHGFGSKLLEYIATSYPEYVQRLEAEPENAPAMALYRKSGFHELKYTELVRNDK